MTEDRFKCREANVNDVLSIIEVYQNSFRKTIKDEVLLFHDKLHFALNTDNEIWIAALADPGKILKELLLFLIEKTKTKADIAYCTTHSITFKDLELTRKVGFKVFRS